MTNAHDVFCRICNAGVGVGCAYPDGTQLDPNYSHGVRVFDALVAKERMAEVLKATAVVPEPRDSESEPFFGGFTYG